MTMTDNADFPVIRPAWPAPPNVQAAATTRQGGVSTGPFATLNLGFHTDDDPQRVAENRRRLAARLELPGPPRWLQQVHGSQVVRADLVTGLATADASYTRRRGVVCAVMTADCLPVLLCHRQGQAVAAIHAGWRGLVAGVIPATWAALAASSPTHVASGNDWLAWLGPAIGGAVYEVGADVRAAFDAVGDYAAAFAPSPAHADRWLLDVASVARQQLVALGVAVYRGDGAHPDANDCTFSAPDRFFSHRRDGRCGRLAALIWLQ